MSLWMVRGDKYGQQQSVALEQRIAYVGFIEVPDLSRAKTRESVIGICREAFPDRKENQVRGYAAQLFAFAYRITEGDLLIMPLRSRHR